MSQALQLLAALRAGHAGGVLNAQQVEELAAILNIQPQALPGLVTQLQRDGSVELIYGGGVRVLPEKPSAATQQYITVGPGALNQVAGGNAFIGVANTDASALGQLAVALQQLRAVQPTLTGDAAMVATNTEQALT